jgi:hypothetical protein
MTDEWTALEGSIRSSKADAIRIRVAIVLSRLCAQPSQRIGGLWAFYQKLRDKFGIQSELQPHRVAEPT